MSDTLTLPAEAREQVGKGASRSLRREGRVPAVVYGGNEAPLSIHVELKELTRQLATGHFFNSIVEIEVGGQKLRTLPKDVAFHPVNDRPLHADFLRLTGATLVHVKVPVVFTNEAKSPGIKRGGMLNVVHHELHLVMRSDAIPDDIVVDLTGLESGSSIHLRDIVLPEGSTDDSHERDLVIATVVAPPSLKSEEGDNAKG